MHPIERLRYVARASGADPETLVRESAGALGALGIDGAGLVTACRRIVDRHVTCGPLWTLCARVLTSAEPRRDAWTFADAMAEDPTGDHLADALPDDARVVVLGWPTMIEQALVRRGDVRAMVVDVLGEGSGLARRLRRADADVTEVAVSGLGAAVANADLVLLEASAIGPDGFLAVAGSRAAAATAWCDERPVWVVTGVGRLLHPDMWAALTRRFAGSGDPWEADDELVPLALVHHVCGPDGVQTVADAITGPTSPVTPELFVAARS